MGSWRSYWLFGLVVTILILSFHFNQAYKLLTFDWSKLWAQDESILVIKKELEPFFSRLEFPSSLQSSNSEDSWQIDYTFDPELQNFADRLLKSYKPDLGTIVLLEAQTGEVLVMSQYVGSKNINPKMNWCLNQPFVAASLFKMVTAAATLEYKKLDLESPIWFNGGSHTLYKKNVHQLVWNKWTRSTNLVEAFAHSYNTPFARIAMEHLSPENLEEMAINLGFNRLLYSDMILPLGRTQIPSEKSFTFAEIVTGFNRLTSTHSLHAAMMASAVANQGKIMTPFWIKRAKRVTQESWDYVAEARLFSQAFSPEVAEKMKILMRETIFSGTSKKSFRDLLRKWQRSNYELELGGKTGSLTNLSPRGKVDWFIGYAVTEDQRKLAVAALTLNEQKWKVKSSYLARQIIEKAISKNQGGWNLGCRSCNE